MKHARPPSPSRRGRALLVVGVAALLGAGGLVAGALWSADTTDAVFEVEDAVAEVTPSTIPLLVDGTSSGDESSGQSAGGETASTDGTEAADGVETPDGVELSPLAELLGPQGSAIPPEIEPRVRPATVSIAAIDMTGPVREVGLNDDGSFEVPHESEIGWYRYGAAPGHPGATVLAAHVYWEGVEGPFHKLGRLEPGDGVDVALADGTRRRYEVVERVMYDKDELPRNRIWRNTGPETLVLITCGGDFNPEIRRYRQNIVVYAVPVGSSSAAS